MMLRIGFPGPDLPPLPNGRLPASQAAVARFVPGKKIFKTRMKLL
jgi:hypothetical protein